MKGKCLTILTLVLLASLLLTPVQATLTRYVWDNVHFMEGRDDQHDIKYPHPDRDYYDISCFNDWSIAGTDLYHNQLEYAKSSVVVAGAIGFFTLVGAWVAAKAGGGTLAIVVGGAVGLALGLLMTFVANKLLLDEGGCIWWWMSKSFVDWIVANKDMLYAFINNNPIGAGILITQVFNSCGYCRVGAIALFDAIGVGSPSPNPRHTLSISVNHVEGGTVDPDVGTYTYDYGEVVTVTAYPVLVGDWYFNCWILDGVPNPGQEVEFWVNQINVTMNRDHTLMAYFSCVWNPPFCPTLFVWNSTDYVEEGFLNIHAETDVTVQHEIENPLALEGKYNLQLRELDNFTSHIDQVRLYAVDYKGNWYLCPLTYAIHNTLGKVKQTLRFDDSNRVDLKPTENISLKFAPPISYDKTAQFTFEINGYNMKIPG